MIAQILYLCIASVAAVGPYAVPSYESPTFEPVYESKPEPYSFGFDTQDEYGRTLTRQEEGDELGNKRGSYGYVDPYGIYRQVEYVADDKGFRAVIKTNEPGTENQSPANIEILSEAAPIKYDPALYGKASAANGYARPVSVVAPTYVKPSVSVSSSASLTSDTPLAPAEPLAPTAPIAPASSLAPVTPLSAVRPHAPASSHTTTFRKPTPAVFTPAPVHAPAPPAFAPVAAGYNAVTTAYAPAPIYDPRDPRSQQQQQQSYASQSYEQLPERPRQSTESRSSSE